MGKTDVSGIQAHLVVQDATKTLNLKLSEGRSCAVYPLILWRGGQQLTLQANQCKNLQEHAQSINSYASNLFSQLLHDVNEPTSLESRGSIPTCEQASYSLTGRDGALSKSETHIERTVIYNATLQDKLSALSDQLQACIAQLIDFVNSIIDAPDSSADVAEFEIEEEPVDIETDPTIDVSDVLSDVGEVEEGFTQYGVWYSDAETPEAMSIDVALDGSVQKDQPPPFSYRCGMRTLYPQLTPSQQHYFAKDRYKRDLTKCMDAIIGVVGKERFENATSIKYTNEGVIIDGAPAQARTQVQHFLFTLRQAESEKWRRLLEAPLAKMRKEDLQSLYNNVCEELRRTDGTVPYDKSESEQDNASMEEMHTCFSSENAKYYTWRQVNALPFLQGPFSGKKLVAALRLQDALKKWEGSHTTPSEPTPSPSLSTDSYGEGEKTRSRSVSVASSTSLYPSLDSEEEYLRRDLSDALFEMDNASERSEQRSASFGRSWSRDNQPQKNWPFYNWVNNGLSKLAGSAQYGTTKEKCREIFDSLIGERERLRTALSNRGYDPSRRLSVADLQKRLDALEWSEQARAREYSEKVRRHQKEKTQAEALSEQLRKYRAILSEDDAHFWHDPTPVMSSEEEAYAAHIKRLQELLESIESTINDRCNFLMKIDPKCEAKNSILCDEYQLRRKNAADRLGCAPTYKAIKDAFEKRKQSVSDTIDAILAAEEERRKRVVPPFSSVHEAPDQDAWHRYRKLAQHLRLTENIDTGKIDCAALEKECITALQKRIKEFNELLQADRQGWELLGIEIPPFVSVDSDNLAGIDAIETRLHALLEQESTHAQTQASAEAILKNICTKHRLSILEERRYMLKACEDVFSKLKILLQELMNDGVGEGLNEKTILALAAAVDKAQEEQKRFVQGEKKHLLGAITTKRWLPAFSKEVDALRSQINAMQTRKEAQACDDTYKYILTEHTEAEAKRREFCEWYNASRSELSRVLDTFNRPDAKLRSKQLDVYDPFDEAEVTHDLDTDRSMINRMVMADISQKEASLEKQLNKVREAEKLSNIVHEEVVAPSSTSIDEQYRFIQEKKLDLSNRLDAIVSKWFEHTLFVDRNNLADSINTFLETKERALKDRLNGLMEDTPSVHPPNIQVKDYNSYIDCKNAVEDFIARTTAYRAQLARANGDAIARENTERLALKQKCASTVTFLDNDVVTRLYQQATTALATDQTFYDDNFTRFKKQRRAFIESYTKAVEEKKIELGRYNTGLKNRYTEATQSLHNLDSPLFQIVSDQLEEVKELGALHPFPEKSDEDSVQELAQKNGLAQQVVTHAQQLANAHATLYESAVTKAQGNYALQQTKAAELVNSARSMLTGLQLLQDNTSKSNAPIFQQPLPPLRPSINSLQQSVDILDELSKANVTNPEEIFKAIDALQETMAGTSSSMESAKSLIRKWVTNYSGSAQQGWPQLQEFEQRIAGMPDVGKKKKVFLTKERLVHLCEVPRRSTAIVANTIQAITDCLNANTIPSITACVKLDKAVQAPIKGVESLWTNFIVQKVFTTSKAQYDVVYRALKNAVRNELSVLLEYRISSISALVETLCKTYTKEVHKACMKCLKGALEDPKGYLTSIDKTEIEKQDLASNNAIERYKVAKNRGTEHQKPPRVAAQHARLYGIEIEQLQQRVTNTDIQVVALQPQFLPFGRSSSVEVQHDPLVAAFLEVEKDPTATKKFQRELLKAFDKRQHTGFYATTTSAAMRRWVHNQLDQLDPSSAAYATWLKASLALYPQRWEMTYDEAKKLAGYANRAMEGKKDLEGLCGVNAYLLGKEKQRVCNYPQNNILESVSQDLRTFIEHFYTLEGFSWATIDTTTGLHFQDMRTHLPFWTREASDQENESVHTVEGLRACYSACAVGDQEKWLEALQTHQGTIGNWPSTFAMAGRLLQQLEQGNKTWFIEELVTLLWKKEGSARQLPEQLVLFGLQHGVGLNIAGDVVKSTAVNSATLQQKYDKTSLVHRAIRMLAALQGNAMDTVFFTEFFAWQLALETRGDEQTLSEQQAISILNAQLEHYGESIATSATSIDDITATWNDLHERSLPFILSGVTKGKGATLQLKATNGASYHLDCATGRIDAVGSGSGQCNQVYQSREWIEAFGRTKIPLDQEGGNAFVSREKIDHNPVLRVIVEGTTTRLYRYDQVAKGYVQFLTRPKVKDGLPPSIRFDRRYQCWSSATTIYVTDAQHMHCFSYNNGSWKDSKGTRVVFDNEHSLKALGWHHYAVDGEVTVPQLGIRIKDNKVVDGPLKNAYWVEGLTFQRDGKTFYVQHDRGAHEKFRDDFENDGRLLEEAFSKLDQARSGSITPSEGGKALQKARCLIDAQRHAPSALPYVVYRKEGANYHPESYAAFVDQALYSDEKGRDEACHHLLSYYSDQLAVEQFKKFEQSIENEAPVSTGALCVLAQACRTSLQRCAEKGCADTAIDRYAKLLDAVEHILAQREVAQNDRFAPWIIQQKMSEEVKASPHTLQDIFGADLHAITVRPHRSEKHTDEIDFLKKNMIPGVKERLLLLGVNHDNAFEEKVEQLLGQRPTNTAALFDTKGVVKSERVDLDTLTKTLLGTNLFAALTEKQQHGIRRCMRLVLRMQLAAYDYRTLGGLDDYKGKLVQEQKKLQKHIEWELDGGMALEDLTDYYLHARYPESIEAPEKLHNLLTRYYLLQRRTQLLQGGAQAVYLLQQGELWDTQGLVSNDAARARRARVLLLGEAALDSCILRIEQIDGLEQILTTEKPHMLLESKMGSGKTSVFLSLLTSYYAQPGKLVRMVLPGSHLETQARSQVAKRFYTLQKKGRFEILQLGRWSIRADSSEDAFTNLHTSVKRLNAHLKVLQERGAVVAVDAYADSQYYAQIAEWKKLCDQLSGFRKRELEKAIATLKEAFSRFDVALIDEVDATRHPDRIATNHVFGKMRECAPEEAFAIADHLVNDKQGTSQNAGSGYRHFCDKYAKYKKQLALEKYGKDFILDLQQRPDGTYDARPGRFQAVPVAYGQASAHSEFKDFALVAMRTHKALSQMPITDTHLLELAKSSFAWKESQLATFSDSLKDALEELAVSSLPSHQQATLKKCHDALKNQVDAKHFRGLLLAFILSTHVRYGDAIAQSGAYEEVCPKTISFTGTATERDADRRYDLEKNYDKASTAEIRAKLTMRAAGTLQAAEPTKEQFLPENISSVFAHKQSSALIDVAGFYAAFRGREVAKKLHNALKVSIVYFDERDNAPYIYDGQSHQPYKAEQKKEQKVLYYFDVARTRGTDLPMAENTATVVTYDDSVTLADFKQGCLRNRALGADAGSATYRIWSAKEIQAEEVFKKLTAKNDAEQRLVAATRYKQQIEAILRQAAFNREDNREYQDILKECGAIGEEKPGCQPVPSETAEEYRARALRTAVKLGDATVKKIEALQPPIDSVINLSDQQRHVQQNVQQQHIVEQQQEQVELQVQQQQHKARPSIDRSPVQFFSQPTRLQPHSCVFNVNEEAHKKFEEGELALLRGHYLPKDSTLTVSKNLFARFNADFFGGTVFCLSKGKEIVLCDELDRSKYPDYECTSVQEYPHLPQLLRTFGLQNFTTEYRAFDASHRCFAVIEQLKTDDGCGGYRFKEEYRLSSDSPKLEWLEKVESSTNQVDPQSFDLEFFDRIFTQHTSYLQNKPSDFVLPRPHMHVEGSDILNGFLCYSQKGTGESIQKERYKINREENSADVFLFKKGDKTYRTTTSVEHLRSGYQAEESALFNTGLSSRNLPKKRNGTCTTKDGSFIARGGTLLHALIILLNIEKYSDDQKRRREHLENGKGGSLVRTTEGAITLYAVPDSHRFAQNTCHPFAVADAGSVVQGIEKWCETVQGKGETKYFKDSQTVYTQLEIINHLLQKVQATIDKSKKPPSAVDGEVCNMLYYCADFLKALNCNCNDMPIGLKGLKGLKGLERAQSYVQEKLEELRPAQQQAARQKGKKVSTTRSNASVLSQGGTNPSYQKPSGKSKHTSRPVSAPVHRRRADNPPSKKRPASAKTGKKSTAAFLKRLAQPKHNAEKVSKEQNSHPWR